MQGSTLACDGILHRARNSATPSILLRPTTPPGSHVFSDPRPVRPRDPANPAGCQPCKAKKERCSDTRPCPRCVESDTPEDCIMITAEGIRGTSSREHKLPSAKNAMLLMRSSSFPDIFPKLPSSPPPAFSSDKSTAAARLSLLPLPGCLHLLRQDCNQLPPPSLPSSTLLHPIPTRSIPPSHTTPKLRIKPTPILLSVMSQPGSDHGDHVPRHGRSPARGPQRPVHSHQPTHHHQRHDAKHQTAADPALTDA